MSKKSLDALGVAITNAGYTWTPEMRSAYEKGIRESEWVGLTDEEIDGIYKTHHDQYGKCQTGGFEYERTIEAKLKEKNT